MKYFFLIGLVGASYANPSLVISGHLSNTSGSLPSKSLEVTGSAVGYAMTGNPSSQAFARSGSSQVRGVGGGLSLGVDQRVGSSFILGIAGGGAFLGAKGVQDYYYGLPYPQTAQSITYAGPQTPGMLVGPTPATVVGSITQDISNPPYAVTATDATVLTELEVLPQPLTTITSPSFLTSSPSMQWAQLAFRDKGHLNVAFRAGFQIDRIQLMGKVGYAYHFIQANLYQESNGRTALSKKGGSCLLLGGEAQVLVTSAVSIGGGFHFHKGSFKITPKAYSATIEKKIRLWEMMGTISYRLPIF